MIITFKIAGPDEINNNNNNNNIKINIKEASIYLVANRLLMIFVAGLYSLSIRT